MREITLIKLGGSLITDKRVPRTFLPSRLRALAPVMVELAEQPSGSSLVIGHGSGSFGHVTAKKHGTAKGVSGSKAWKGFSEVALAASELNLLVAGELAEAGLPIFRLQPSAGTLCAGGKLVHWDLTSVQTALLRGLVPLVYGDVAFDAAWGGTITSTEMLFFYIAEHLPVSQILLLGEVEGVLDQSGQRIPTITPDSLSSVEDALGGSSGTDVTGGMESKVRDMVALVQRVRGLRVRILDGRQPELLRHALEPNFDQGTLIIDES